MYDFGVVCRKRLASLEVLFSNHVENVGKFCECGFPRGQERVAARDGRDLCNPPIRLVAVKHDLVVVQTYAVSLPPTREWCRYVGVREASAFNPRMARAFIASQLPEINLR
jgi:hypothetical protein